MARVVANGLRLEVERDGSGEPLLMIMGVGSQLVWWPEPLVGALVEQGFQAIRFDNRDIGLSEQLHHLGEPPILRHIPRSLLGLPVPAPYTLSDMATDAAGILDALELPAAHVVGVSMGGMIAQHLALEHPERVRSLTLMMTGSGDRWRGLGRPRAIAALLGRTPTTVQEAEEGLIRITRVIGSPGFDFEEEWLRRKARLAFERGRSPAGFRRQLAAILAQEDRTDRLRALQVPTTVIHGSADPLVPPSAGLQLAQAIPDARLELIEGMGHSLPLPLAGRFAELIAETAGRAGLDRAAG